ncbi:MAG: MarR family transcriptional regulator [Gemmatimonadota bacterium]|nr:MarR family transcriptional regulator [Gemmatimonadota bacterium]
MPSPPRSLADALRQGQPFRSPAQEALLGLFRTADDLRRQAALRFEAHGITTQQYNVLRILRGAGAGGLAVGQIAERMVERTPGVTRLVDRLVDAGWVDRDRSADDRRVVVCRLKDAGRDLLAVLDPTVEGMEEELLGSLTEEEQVQLTTLLDRIRAELPELEAPGCEASDGATDPDANHTRTDNGART